MEKQHPTFNWEKVEGDIFSCIKKAFAAAAVQYKMSAPNARSIYGVDIMLTDTFQPQILEVTYCPELKLVARQQPSFINDAFACLFLDKTEGLRRI